MDFQKIPKKEFDEGSNAGWIKCAICDEVFNEDEIADFTENICQNCWDLENGI